MTRNSPPFWFYILIISLFVACSREIPPDLPTIEILSPNNLDYSQKKNATFYYITNRDTKELEGRIRYSGEPSANNKKASLALELNKKAVLGNISKDDDWILNACYMDKSFLRHKLSYDLFRRLGAQNKAAKTAYVNVIHNQKRNGLYVLMEKINAGMLELDKKDPLAILLEEPPIFLRKAPLVQDVRENYYQQKFPKIEDQDHSNFINRFMNFLWNSSNKQFAEEISAWVDIDNMIDWHLICLMANNPDGLYNNFYWYKKNTDTPFRVAIWDYEASFGRARDNSKLNSNVEDLRLSILFKRLLETNVINYQDRLKTKWKTLRDNNIISVGSMNNRINVIDQKIWKAVEDNAVIWPLTEAAYKDDFNYEQEVEFIKQYWHKKLSHLDEYIADL